MWQVVPSGIQLPLYLFTLLSQQKHFSQQERTANRREYKKAFCFVCFRIVDQDLRSVALGISSFFHVALGNLSVSWFTKNFRNVQICTLNWQSFFCHLFQCLSQDQSSWEECLTAHVSCGNKLVVKRPTACTMILINSGKKHEKFRKMIHVHLQFKKDFYLIYQPAEWDLLITCKGSVHHAKLGTHTKQQFWLHVSAFNQHISGPLTCPMSSTFSHWQGVYFSLPQTKIFKLHLQDVHAWCLNQRCWNRNPLGCCNVLAVVEKIQTRSIFRGVTWWQGQDRSCKPGHCFWWAGKLDWWKDKDVANQKHSLQVTEIRSTNLCLVVLGGKRCLKQHEVSKTK